MTTAKIGLTLFLALLMGAGLLACEKAPTAEPLRLSAEQPEAGWTYATADGITAACPRSWTLADMRHPRRPWRCIHPSGLDGHAVCGLTVYPTQGATTLQELVDIMTPELEDYGARSEILSTGETTLGGHDAWEFVIEQTMSQTRFGEDGEYMEYFDVRSWYRLALIDGMAWLGHCSIPEELAEDEEQLVEEIFERIEM